MTREEATAVLRREIEPSVYEDEKSIAEAIDMAIEALSAEEAVWKEYEAEFTDLPDIPRYYYEKVVGNMAHEINMLKEQLESANAEQGVGRYENAMQKLREMPRYLNGVKEKQITKISAEAVPTVIRAKTFMRKEDFDKWAEDIKKQNKSIVCIPCDAEVVSADAVQGEWVDWLGNGNEWECSVCKCSIESHGSIAYNYCPMCGAKMKGGAE